MRIYLVGMPGSGKTTLGKALAKNLQIPFLDLDASIEMSERMSIPDIFEKKGEDYFRQRESQSVNRTKTMSNAIFATGGGAPCFHDNMAFMNEHGLTIYFKVSPEELSHRLMKNNDRPLLKGKSGEELVEELKKKMEERAPYYEEAKVKVEGDQLMVEDVLEKVEPYLKA